MSNGEPLMKTAMYARREPDGFYALRQERYRQRLADGNEHSHDVCAVARTVEELRSMCDKHWPNINYNDVEKR